MLAVAALRNLIALPLLVLAIGFGVAPAPLPWAVALGWSLRVSLAVLALQPIWVIGAFSKNTNDSSARTWFTALLAVVILVELIISVTAGVMLFALDGLGSALLAGLVLAGATHLALVFYGWAYNRGIFDLIARPRTG